MSMKLVYDSWIPARNGKLAYDTWVAEVGHDAVAWEKLTAKAQNAWNVVALRIERQAVEQLMLKQKKMLSTFMIREREPAVPSSRDPNVPID